jgi:dihydroceramidase
VTGFILWNVDNAFCAELSAFREAVGMPLGFVSELHGWQVTPDFLLGIFK